MTISLAKFGSLWLSLASVHKVRETLPPRKLLTTTRGLLFIGASSRTFLASDWSLDLSSHRHPSHQRVAHLKAERPCSYVNAASNGARSVTRHFLRVLLSHHGRRAGVDETSLGTPRCKTLRARLMAQQCPQIQPSLMKMVARPRMARLTSLRMDLPCWCRQKCHTRRLPSLNRDTVMPHPLAG